MACNPNCPTPHRSVAFKCTWFFVGRGNMHQGERTTPHLPLLHLTGVYGLHSWTYPGEGVVGPLGSKCKILQEEAQGPHLETNVCTCFAGLPQPPPLFADCSTCLSRRDVCRLNHLMFLWRVDPVCSTAMVFWGLSQTKRQGLLAPV